MTTPKTQHRPNQGGFRILSAGVVALACLLAAAAPALAQAPKGAPKGAAPGQPGARAQGQEVTPDGQALPAPIPPSELADPRQHMRAFISSIGTYARTLNRNFVVLTMDGLDLLERVDPIDPAKRAAAETYIRTIDGVIARNVEFHPPNERGEIKTEADAHAELLRLLDIGQTRGLRIWTIDYAKDLAMAQESIRAARKKSYIPFPAMEPNTRFNALPRFASRPLNENPNAITGINHVKNFLMLTDSAHWDTQEEFVLALADTNYDAIVVDVFHRGRTPLTARSIEGLRYKKLGTRRLVLAYANIGEAESYRYYWKPDWKEGSPHYIDAPSPSNPDKYAVHYWEPGWQNIVTGNVNSYIYGILAQGFDGVVLDGVDIYRTYESPQ